MIHPYMLKWRVGGCLSHGKYTTGVLRTEFPGFPNILEDFLRGEEKISYEKARRFISWSQDFPDI